jgi:hypothetical protein
LLAEKAGMTKLKIPKRIAGVKVPKKLRRQAKKLLKVSASPMVRDLALAGLSLAAQRMLDAGRDAAPAAARPDRKPKGALHGLNLAALVEAAAAEGARRFLENYEADAPAAEAAPKAPTKPAPKAAPRRRRPGVARQA